MADTWVWVLFVVLFVLLAPLWVSDMSFGAYIITIGLATFQNYRDYVDMPASVFWILFVLLLPTVLIPGSFGSAALYALVIAHVNLTNPDVPKTWLLADIFWLIHFLMNIGYWLAWPSLYSFLLTALPVEMPISWHAMSLSIITGSALLIHPELSLGRLWGWIVAIFFIYPALRPFYCPKSGARSWGTCTRSFKSLKSNYNASLENIVFSDMTKNMRDAVQITASLGFSYLWIDSLCIIQDSKEDWEAEAKTMGDVYAGAACTIASTGSSSSDGGCFHERSALGLQPCVIGASSRNHLIPEWIYIRRDDLSEFRRGVDHAVLNSRGWVLQERLLSRRILHFGAEMMYWECCQRAASELNPTGYIYKLYPQEYYGNYVPVQTDTDPRERERVEGWSRTALIRRRTPPPDFDPDHIFAGRTIWQGPRGFWKEARRWSAADWRYDDSHKRFRTALDKLQNDEFWSDVAGMGSFSTCWYEIVELYTRTRLTYSSDKLVAIWGIVQQIEKQTKQQCVAGLWSGYLLTDLLWFTAEGPGRRLLEDPPKVLLTANPGSIPAESAHDEPAGESQSNDTEADQHATIPTIERVAMAPTWSWASVEAIVTNDLLPENAGRKVYLESLAQDVKASVRAVRPEQEGELRAALAGILEMRAPISRISKLKQQGEAWIIGLERNAYPTARLFPDIEISEESAVQDDLFCVACVVLKREAEQGVLNRKIEEVQGIVVRKTEQRVDKPDLFQRVGFFTTNRMEKPSSYRKQLKNGRMNLIYIE
ncbi:HET-domain-containing protein [Thozetella sp. PMI_491]|nr:HET-domain-containing protein [Thozetella sp. PMI_491]